MSDENAGIGRQKELHLDEIVRRWDYTDDALQDVAVNDVTARWLLAGLIVLADVLHDVEKQLARLNHTADKP